jgi:hypothetical protein
VQTPSDEGFLADVALVDDVAFEGLSAKGLKEKHTDGAIVSFLADEMTLSDAEQPILAVGVLPSRHDRRPDHRPFRVVPAALWSVENNINLGNMDWTEFTRVPDGDGVFRGF